MDSAEFMGYKDLTDNVGCRDPGNDLGQVYLLGRVKIMLAEHLLCNKCPDLMN